MKDLSTLTLEELIKKKEEIRARCSGWQKCQDGSYEMALDYAGFYDIVEEIRKRKETV